MDKYGPDPEQVGVMTAHALVATIEHFKGRKAHIDAPLEEQVAAGLLAVEAMKNMLRGTMISTQPRDC